MKAEDIESIEDMQRYVEGCLNDFEHGISTKKETLEHFKEYTFRVLFLGMSELDKKLSKENK